MIVGLEGKIEKKEPTFIHINVNGVIYEVNISINTSNSIDSKSIKLLITQIIREDSNLLYGFLDINEKKMFDTLIKVSGIGPKVAIAICSTFIPSTFTQIIANRDVNYLKKVPGIGAKSASRILVELSDFIVDTNRVEDKSMSEAIMALESLGFKHEHIKKALKGASGNTAELVKQGLKRLQRL